MNFQTKPKLYLMRQLKDFNEPKLISKFKPNQKVLLKRHVEKVGTRKNNDIVIIWTESQTYTRGMAFNECSVAFNECSGLIYHFCENLENKDYLGGRFHFWKLSSQRVYDEIVGN